MTLRGSNARVVSGAQGSEDWFLMRFGRITSIGAALIMECASSIEPKTHDALDAENEVQAVILRK